MSKKDNFFWKIFFIHIFQFAIVLFIVLFLIYRNPCLWWTIILTPIFIADAFLIGGYFMILRLRYGVAGIKEKKLLKGSSGVFTYFFIITGILLVMGVTMSSHYYICKST